MYLNKSQKTFVCTPALEGCLRAGTCPPLVLRVRFGGAFAWCSGAACCVSGYWLYVR